LVVGEVGAGREWLAVAAMARESWERAAAVAMARAPQETVVEGVMAPGWVVAGSPRGSLVAVAVREASLAEGREEAPARQEVAVMVEEATVVAETAPVGMAAGQAVASRAAAAKAPAASGTAVAVATAQGCSVGRKAGGATAGTAVELAAATLAAAATALAVRAMAVEVGRARGWRWAAGAAVRAAGGTWSQAN
jgi:hypothetical protein